MFIDELLGAVPERHVPVEHVKDDFGQPLPISVNPLLLRNMQRKCIGKV